MANFYLVVKKGNDEKKLNFTLSYLFNPILNATSLTLRDDTFNIVFNEHTIEDELVIIEKLFEYLDEKNQIITEIREANDNISEIRVLIDKLIK